MGVFAFCILGPLEIRHEGGLVPMRGVRERAVLAVLLLEAGHVVPVARLVDAVWDDDPPQAAEKAIRNAVSALRGRLVQAGGLQAIIETSAAGYRLRLNGTWLDAGQFSEHAAAARGLAGTGRPAEAVAEFRAALGLWRGPALAGLDGAMIGAAAARLDERRLAAWEECLDLELRLARHREVIDELLGLVSEHPLRERVAGQLMLALYRAGRQAEALDAYHRLAKRLADDLGLDASGDITRLHESVLRQDPVLDLPQTAAETGQATAAGGLGRPADPDDTWSSRDAAPPVPAQLPLDVPGFAGRVAELGQLHALLPAGSGAPGAPTVVISAIGGTPGVGKTALAVHFAREIADRFTDGQLYANLRGFDPSASAVSPGEVLNRFLAALGAAPDTIPGSVDAQAGLYRSLLDGKRVLVLLDNARDAGQVRPLLPGSPGCLVIVTSRSELTGLAAAEGAHPLTLDVLAEDEAQDLLARRLGPDRLDREPAAAEELAALCARLPLALVIVAARAAAKPGLALAELAAELRDTNRRLEALEAGDPATDVRAVFSWSYQQLSAPAGWMFRLLGLHPGPDITSAAAASLAAVPEPGARRLLAELSRAHLVIEHARGRFTFHDLLRAYAAEQARNLDSDAERRAATHQLLDHYLHTACAASRPANPARRMISIAAPRPGVQPERFTGNQDALAWLDTEYRVLLSAASHAAESGFDVHAWQLPWMLSRFQDRRGYWHERVASQQLALAAAQRLGDQAAQARVHYEIAGACNVIGRHEDSGAHGKLAYELYERLGDREGQATSIGIIGRTLEWQGRWREALEHAQRQLELYQALGDQIRIAHALNYVGWYSIRLGEFERARDCCERALSILQGFDDVLGKATTLDTLGLTHHHTGGYGEAAACYREAIRLYQEAGDRPERARTLVRLGDVHEAAGDRRSAREAWQEALDTFDELQLPDTDEIRARLADQGPR